MGYSKLMFLFFVLYHFILSGNFYYGSEIRHGIFWGINFGPGIFWGFCLKPKGFFWGFDFCPHSTIPVTWNPEHSLWAWVKLKRTLNFSHYLSQVNLYFSDWKLCGEEQWKKTNLLKAVKSITDDTTKHRPKPAFLGKTISLVVQCNTAESIIDLTFFLSDINWKRQYWPFYNSN